MIALLKLVYDNWVITAILLWPIGYFGASFVLDVIRLFRMTQATWKLRALREMRERYQQYLKMGINERLMSDVIADIDNVIVTRYRRRP